MSTLYLLLLSFMLSLSIFITQKFCAHKKRELLARAHGCLPAPLLEHHLPLGLDRFKQIFKANSESRLMELFLFHFQQIGNTQQQRFLFTSIYGTIDPINLEIILSTNSKDWSTKPRRAITFPMFGDGIFTQEGDSWRNSRLILRPQFQHHYYDESIQHLFETIQKEKHNNDIVDLHPIFNRFTLDITTKFLFGRNIQSLKAPNAANEKQFSIAFNTAQEYVVKRFRLLDFYWFIDGLRFRIACRQLHSFAGNIIDNSSVTNEHAHFLKSVASKISSREALRGQIINILAAGRDTTACLLSWAFFLLIRHPQKLKTLQQEVFKTIKQLGGEQITRGHLLKMNYLQNVLRETLRLYPPLPLNARSAIRDTILPVGGGTDGCSPILVPKGSMVAFSTYAMHRRTDLYGQDANLFRPERWGEKLPMDSCPILRGWGYLPFNGGPRMCLGKDLAIVEASYAIFRILQKFPAMMLPSDERVERVGSEKQTVTLVLTSSNGCRVHIPRAKN